MQPYVIGIDVGTGSIKAVAVGKSNNVLASAQSYYEFVSDTPGYAEQDANIIWQAFTGTLQKIIVQLGHIPSLVALSSYMHGIMVVNENCIPLTRLITWADIRSEGIASKIRQSAKAESLYRATGAPIHSMLPLCKIMWLQGHHPELFIQGNRFISIKEYIWYQLFQVYEIDYSVAGATGLFNMHAKDWHQDALLLCNISSDFLSVPVQPDLLRYPVKKDMAALLGIDECTRFCIGGSDGCMAVIGSGALHPGSAALTIGTSGAVRIATETPLFIYPQMVFNYILEHNLFVCGGAINNGGNVALWLLERFWGRKTIMAEDYLQLFNSVQDVKPGSNGLLFLPYIYGERAPLWDEKASGVFAGMRAMHTNGHLSRAVLEGICFSLNTIIELIDNSIPIRQICVSGGFIHSREWLQILADISGKIICIGHTEDASALGAAFMGMKSAGWIKEYPTNTGGQNDDSFIHPNKDYELLYRDLFVLFKEVYVQLKDTLHRLYDLESR